MKPQTHKKIQPKAVLGILMSIFWFFLTKDLYQFVHWIVYVILMGLILALFIFNLLLLTEEKYEAVCPYCKKKITVPLESQALDCPYCNERILIEDYKLQKKS